MFNKDELIQFLAIKDHSVFCIIENKITYITNDAIIRMAHKKNIKIPEINNMYFKDKIKFCESNFNLEDLLLEQEGILFYGELSKENDAS